MTPLRLTSAPPRRELRRQLRPAVGHLGRPLRVIAEDLTGLDASIDLVAADPGGRVVLVLVADEGEDLELVANGLAQRDWLEPRLADWRKLAPELDIRPDRGVGLLLLAPAFGPRALAAARAAGPDGVELARYRFVEGPGVAEGPPHLFLERVHVGRAARSLQVAGEETADAASSPFRTGLTDADLRPLRADAASGD